MNRKCVIYRKWSSASEKYEPIAILQHYEILSFIHSGYKTLAILVDIVTGEIVEESLDHIKIIT